MGLMRLRATSFRSVRSCSTGSLLGAHCSGTAPVGRCGKWWSSADASTSVIQRIDREEVKVTRNIDSSSTRFT